MSDIFAEIGANSPKGKSGIAGAVATSLTNCAGGVIAGRVRDIIRDQFKQFPSAGNLGVFAVSVGIRVYAADNSTMSAVLRELAAGMAGEVGDDMWLILKGWLGLGVKTWEPGKTYGKGTEVRYGSQVYQASEDVPASSGPPDADKKWRLLRAQGLDSQELGSLARRMVQDDGFWAAVDKDFAQALDSRLGGLAAQMPQQMPPEFWQQVLVQARSALQTTAERIVEG